ncbi:MAG: DUF899 family protein [Paracoccaceae bacterium]
MTVSFPNESPAYRDARNALLNSELDLRQKTEEVAALRRALPKGGTIAKDYSFTSLDGSAAPLSSLFGDHDTLAIYSLMYGPQAEAPCPACSSLLDGLAGHVGQLSRRISLVIVAQNTPEKLTALSAHMGWQALPLYSALGTSYQRDYLAENSDGNQMPMMNVFCRDGDGIHHFWGSEMLFEPSPWHPRHMDTVWPLWNVLDMTPQGRGDFMPSLR